MKLSAAIVLAGLSFTSLAGTACSPSAEDSAASDSSFTSSREVVATTQLEAFSSVRNVQTIFASQYQIRLYEIGSSGDPARSRLWLTADGDVRGHGFDPAFDLGLDVSGVTTVSMSERNTLKIAGTRRDVDASGAAVDAPFEAKVELSIHDGELASTATLTAASGVRTLEASTDSTWKLLGDLYDVQQIQNDQVTARIFERDSGDRATNRTTVALSVTSASGARIYDLGLAIDSVSRLAFTSPTSIRLYAVEDVSSADHVTALAPVNFDVTFGSPGGASSAAVQVTRVNE